MLDTSAIIRLYVPDGPLPDGTEEAVEAAWRGEGMLLAPDLALAEVAQVLFKKEQSPYLRPDEVDGILDEVLDLPVEVVGHRDLLPGALALARTLRLTVYDALFLQLAPDRQAELLTADADLERVYRHRAP